MLLRKLCLMCLEMCLKLCLRPLSDVFVAACCRGSVRTQHVRCVRLRSTRDGGRGSTPASCPASLSTSDLPWWHTGAVTVITGYRHTSHRAVLSTQHNVLCARTCCGEDISSLASFVLAPVSCFSNNLLLNSIENVNIFIIDIWRLEPQTFTNPSVI